MRRFLRWAQIAALMVAGSYIMLLIVVAIVQPRPTNSWLDNGSAITASQLQAEASVLSATPR